MRDPPRVVVEFHQVRFYCGIGDPSGEVGRVALSCHISGGAVGIFYAYAYINIYVVWQAKNFGIRDALKLFYICLLKNSPSGLAMPSVLLKARQNLDRAVMKLYGFSVKDTSEAACVAELVEKRYRGLAAGEEK